MKSKLGLPLEYRKQPEYFDALNLDGVETKNRLIEKILKNYNVKTVLDLTCGTGAQAIYLAKHGYKVVGSDFSPALLEIARKKVRKEKVSVKFMKGDMRTVKVGQFDAAITISNAVGHLTKAGFEKAMRNIHRNLKVGGLYVFDIFNLNAMTNAAVHNLAMDVRKVVNNIKIHAVQYSKINRKNGLLTSFDHYTFQKSTDKPKIRKNKFTLQIYTAKQLREMLAKNGFTTIAQYGIDGSKFLEHKTISILTVAKREEINSKWKQNEDYVPFDPADYIDDPIVLARIKNRKK